MRVRRNRGLAGLPGHLPDSFTLLALVLVGVARPGVHVASATRGTGGNSQGPHGVMAASIAGDLGHDPQIEVDALALPEVDDDDTGVGGFASNDTLSDDDRSDDDMLQTAKPWCLSNTVFRPGPVEAILRLLSEATVERIRRHSHSSDMKDGPDLPNFTHLFSSADLVQEMDSPVTSKAQLMAKYILMEKLHGEDPDVYFDALRKHPQSIFPVVHSPASALASQTMHMFVKQPRGIYLPASTWISQLIEKGVDLRSSEAQQFYMHRMNDAFKMCSHEDGFPELEHSQGLGAVLVVTDASATRGLLDQGAGGIAIPMGITSAYVAISSFRRQRAIPVIVDFGMDSTRTTWIDGRVCTDQQSAIFGSCDKQRMAEYFGTRSKRFDDMDRHIHPVMDAFVAVARLRWPQALLQWQDWAGSKATRLLRRHRGVTYENDERDRVAPAVSMSVVRATHRPGAVPTMRSFSGNLHGLGVMVVASLLTAAKRLAMPLRSMRFLFAGSGFTATGLVDMIVNGILHVEGKPLTDEVQRADASRQFAFVNHRGLLTASSAISPRTSMFAQAQPNKNTTERWSCDPMDDEVAACMRDVLKRYIGVFRPHVLVGLSGKGGLFSESVLRAMGKLIYRRQRYRPLVFALSSPRGNAECTAQEAYEKTRGLAIFASTTKFPPYNQDPDPELRPSTLTDLLVLPGIAEAAAFGPLDAGLSEELFIVAAQAVAEHMQPAEELHAQVLPDRRRMSAVNKDVCDTVLLRSIRSFQRAMGAVDPAGLQPLSWAERHPLLTALSLSK